MFVPQLGLLFIAPFLCCLQKQHYNVHQNDHNTLGVPKHFQLMHNSFFITYKPVAFGIIGIGQVIKKNQT